MAEGTSVSSEAEPPRIPSVHSSYHGSFFLLRTPVTVHGAQAHITLDQKHSPTLNLPFFGSTIGNFSVLLSRISYVVAEILQNHNVYHVDTFYYENVPLFSLVFDSEASLQQFLRQSQGEVRDKIQNAFANEFGRKTTPRKSVLVFPRRPPPPLPPVDVSVELYHITPDHRLGSAEVELVTLSTFKRFMGQWKESEVFTYYSVFTGEVTSIVKWFEKNKVLAIDDLREVLAAVYEARKKWRWIGLELRLDPTDLDNIQGKDNTECLEGVLTMWLKQQCSKPTWMKLLNALKSKIVGEEGVACNIETHIRRKATEELPGAPQARPPLEEQLHSLKDGSRKAVIHLTAEQLRVSESTLKVSEALRDVTEREQRLTIRHLPELQRKVHRLTEENLEIEGELEARRKTVDGLYSTVKILEKKEKRYKEELMAQNVVLEEKKFQIADLETKLQQKKEALRAAEKELKTLKQVLEAKSAELEKRTAEVIVLRREVHHLRAEVAMQQKLYKAEQRRIEAKEMSCQAQLKAAKDQISKALDEQSCKKCELNKVEEVLEKLSQESTVKEKALKKMQEEIQELKMTACISKEMQASFERETRALRVSLKIAELKLSLLHHDEERDKLQQERDQAVKEIEYLRKTTEMSHVSPLKCGATGSGFESAEKHKQSQFQIMLRDHCNEPFTSIGEHRVTVELRCVSDNSLTKVNLSSESTASYTATYTPIKVGKHELFVKVNDSSIHGSPFHLLVVNHPHPSNCTAVGVGLQKGEKRKLSSFIIHLRDEDHEPCVTTNNCKITADITFEDSFIKIKGETICRTPDTCEVSFTPTRSGEHELSVNVNDAPIHGSPFHLFVLNHLDPKNCTAEGSGVRKGENQERTSFMVNLRDEDGEPCISTRHVVTAQLTSLVDRTVIECRVNSLTLDTHEVSYTPTVRGRHNLSVMVDGVPIQGSPFRVFIKQPPQLIMIEPCKRIELRHQEEVFGLAIASDGKIYIRGKSKVTILTQPQHGSTVFSFAIPQSKTTSGIEADMSDNILCNCNGSLLKFTPRGRKLRNYANNPGFSADFITLSKNKKTLFAVDTHFRMRIFDTDLNPTCPRISLPRQGNGITIHDIGCDDTDRIHVLCSNLANFNLQCRVFSKGGLHLYSLDMSPLDGGCQELKMHCISGCQYVATRTVAPTVTVRHSEHSRPTLFRQTKNEYSVALYAFTVHEGNIRDQSVQLCKISTEYHERPAHAISADDDGYLFLVCSYHDHTYADVF